jgi:hypothetical protein
LHEVDPVGQRTVLNPGLANGFDAVWGHGTPIGGTLLPDKTG